MKKILLTIMVIGAITLTITGCNLNKNEFDIGEKSNINLTQNNITLSIKEETLTNTGATFILKNDSNVDIQYGEPYEIEIKQDGSWHKINVQLDFNMIAYELKAKASQEIDINWENGYGALAKGEYRIIKTINIKKEDGTTENSYVIVEFTIK